MFTICPPNCGQMDRAGAEDFSTFDLENHHKLRLPKLTIPQAFQEYLYRLTEQSPNAESAAGNMDRTLSWGVPERDFEDRFLEEDMAALAERIAVSMLDDDEWSSSSGSEHNTSATTSEEGSPRAWNLNGRGSFVSSRPTSPSWSSSSSYDCDPPSFSCREADARSPDAFQSSHQTPFHKAPVSQHDLISLQKQLESLSAQQLHSLKKALAESQKGRSGRQSEAQGRERPVGKQEKAQRGAREQGRATQYSGQARKLAERRAISALASQQPNERLAVASRASRKGVICGAATVPPAAPKPVLPPPAKENGTGVFLPMMVVPSAPVAGTSQSGPVSSRLSPRSTQHPPVKSTLGPNRRSGTINSQHKQQFPRVPSQPPSVAVVDCSETMRIPVVNFNQRCRMQPGPPPQAQFGPGSNVSRSQLRPNASRQVLDAQMYAQRGMYGQYREAAPQPRWVPASQSGPGTDYLGLPEEWVY